MLGALATALLIVALQVLPVAAVSGPTKLLDPVVGPAAGTPSTTFSFSVTYRNREGSEPDHVHVTIDGVAHAMTADPGTPNWKAGVRFSWSSTLALGVHEIAFQGMDRDKFTDEIAGATVTVSLPPTPTTKPTPAPTPAPTPTPPSPRPTPAPTPAPTPDPTPDPGDPDPDPTPTPDPTDPSANPGSAGPSDDPGPAVPSSGNGASRPGDDGSGRGGKPGRPRDAAAPLAPADPGAPGAGAGRPGAGGTGGSGTGGAGSGGPGDSGSIGGPSVPGGAGGSRSGMVQFQGGWGELSNALSTLGLDPRTPALGVVPVMITTTGAVAMAMAFLFFGKRRRDGEPPEPDEVLAAAAARGTGEVATGALVGQSVIPLSPVDPDALMPRWRRPSLLEARKADPLRTASVVQAMTFDHGLVGPLEGHERRTIRYHVVRLLDTPDELRGAEIGSLLNGDEVQLLERSGTYWLVLCPDGRRGWIHKMTLGDVVGERPSPTAQETWATTSSEPEEVDDDVLTAFMAARGRA